MVKAKIERGREVYRNQDELWEEYFKLHREVKDLVTGE